MINLLSETQKSELKNLLTLLKLLKLHRLSNAEQSNYKECIKLTFETLDKLKVPFKIQNKVIFFIDNNLSKKSFLLDNYNDTLLKLALQEV
jgi:hypothetical protein